MIIQIGKQVIALLIAAIVVLIIHKIIKGHSIESKKESKSLCHTIKNIEKWLLPSILGFLIFDKIMSVAIYIQSEPNHHEKSVWTYFFILIAAMIVSVLMVFAAFILENRYKK